MEVNESVDELNRSNSMPLEQSVVSYFFEFDQNLNKSQIFVANSFEWSLYLILEV